MLRASLPVVDIWKAPQLSGNPRLPAHIPVLILAQVIIRPTPTKEKRRPSTQATRRGQAEMGFVSVTPPYGNARDARATENSTRAYQWARQQRKPPRPREIHNFRRCRDAPQSVSPPCSQRHEPEDTSYSGGGRRDASKFASGRRDDTRGSQAPPRKIRTQDCRTGLGRVPRFCNMQFRPTFE